MHVYRIIDPIVSETLTSLIYVSIQAYLFCCTG